MPIRSTAVELEQEETTAAVSDAFAFDGKLHANKPDAKPRESTYRGDFLSSRGEVKNVLMGRRCCDVVAGEVDIDRDKSDEVVGIDEVKTNGGGVVVRDVWGVCRVACQRRRREEVTRVVLGVVIIDIVDRY